MITSRRLGISSRTDKKPIAGRLIGRGRRFLFYSFGVFIFTSLVVHGKSTTESIFVTFILQGINRGGVPHRQSHVNWIQQAQINGFELSNVIALYQ